MLLLYRDLLGSFLYDSNLYQAFTYFSKNPIRRKVLLIPSGRPPRILTSTATRIFSAVQSDRMLVRIFFSKISLRNTNKDCFRNICQHFLQFSKESTKECFTNSSGNSIRNYFVDFFRKFFLNLFVICLKLFQEFLIKPTKDSIRNSARNPSGIPPKIFPLVLNSSSMSLLSNLPKKSSKQYRNFPQDFFFHNSSRDPMFSLRNYFEIFSK